MTLKSNTPAKAPVKSNTPKSKATAGKEVATPAQRDSMFAAAKAAGEAQGNARILQAKATHLLYSLPNPIGDHPGALYATQGAYAKVIGVTNGTVTGLRTQGAALALGMDDSFVSSMTSTVGNAKVAESVREATRLGSKASVARVVSAVNAARKAKANAPKVAPKAPAPKVKNEKNGTTAPFTIPQSKPRQIDMVLVLLAELATTGLGKAERARMTSEVLPLVTALANGTKIPSLVPVIGAKVPA